MFLAHLLRVLSRVVLSTSCHSVLVFSSSLSCLGSYCVSFRTKNPTVGLFQVGKLRPFSYILFFHAVWLLFQFCVVGMMLCWFGTLKSIVWNGRCHGCRKIVARLANLAQASQSCLGEMNRGSPKPYYARGRPGDPLIILSERASRPSERGLA